MKFSDKSKKFFAGVQIGLLGVVQTIGVILPVNVVSAAAPGTVVINEIAWAGSADASGDEWLELYNSTGVAVDISGWKLTDDGADVLTFPAGSTIDSYGYVVIEDSETAVSNVDADYLVGLSLANNGDAFQLLDETSTVIDTVNASGGAWYAGSSSNYASMERIDALTGDIAGNFADSTGGTGALASAGSAVVGTPGKLNSVSVPQVGQPNINAQFAVADASVGDIVQLQVSAEDVSDLFAYGYELQYDPLVLDYQGATVGTFLSDDGNVGTSFYSALSGGQAGDLLVAEARTMNDPKLGISGSGTLFTLDFMVLAGEGTSVGVDFGPGSFSSSPTGDLSVNLVPASLNVLLGTVEPVTGLQVTEGIGRYQIHLSWNASTSSPDHYRVERMDAHGDWVILAGITETEFVDQDGVIGGGAIIPNLAYQYRVTAVKGSLTSDPVQITAQDTRGLKGDNNRSDLVDGRDLERLALHFAETDLSSGFDPLVDTTYDAQINGNDLIDIGAMFAQQYI